MGQLNITQDEDCAKKQTCTKPPRTLLQHIECIIELIAPVNTLYPP